MHLDEKDLKLNLLDLKIQSGWFIEKNNIIDIDISILEDIDDRERFWIKDIYFMDNIFYANYQVKQGGAILSMVVTVTAKPIVNKINKIESVSYEIETLVLSEFGKKSKTIYSDEKEVVNLNLLKNKLNNLFLYGYIELDSSFKDKNFNKIEEMIKKILHT